MGDSTRQKQQPQTEDKVFSKAFRDPIHDLIYLGREEKFILDLIDTKEFQRLRRIKQLGLAHFVFPGAEHSRFTHSLGVFNFARRVIARLLERHSSESSLDQGIQKELHGGTSKIIKAAALLHDLGHGPFSHVYERVFQKDEGKSLKHDIWTCKILFDPKTEVHQVLKEHKIDINLLAAIISDDAIQEFNVSRPDEPYLKGIISSQLDVDRMDYLLRDSLMTGSRYGRYDQEWILNAISAGFYQLGDNQLKILCLDSSKGTGAIEGLLFARLLMLKNVYGHKTTRAYESELVCALRLAVELSDVLPDDTPKPVLDTLREKGDVDVNTYLMLDDEVMWWALRRWAAWEHPKRKNIKELVSALKRHSLNLVRRRRPWKALKLDHRQFLNAGKLVVALEKNNDKLRFECMLDNLQDLPYKDLAYLHKPGKDEEAAFFGEIFLIDKSGKISGLSEVETSIIDGLSEKLEVYHFYYDREFFEEFTGLLSKYGVC